MEAVTEFEPEKSSWRVFSGNGLKLLAVITMLIDHIGVILIEKRLPGGILALDFSMIMNSPEMSGLFMIDGILRMIGRVAFPLFCFLLVEGFVHTGDIQKYSRRLLLFGIISEIPFDLALFDTCFFAGYQNVYFTLYLGLLGMMAINRYTFHPWKQFFAVAACALGASLLQADYGAFGVLLICVIYLFRGNKKQMTLWGSLLTIWELTAPLAFIPIAMYNGRRGKWNLKYFFYVFYPAHLFLLWAIGKWMI